MLETLDQSALEDMAEEKAVERQFARKERKVDVVKMTAGLSVGLAFLASGAILVIYNGFGSVFVAAYGLLFFPIGLWIFASVALGGLGPSAWYRLWDYRVFRIWWNWIGSKESVEERRKEASEKAEKVEARAESDESKSERERSDFD